MSDISLPHEYQPRLYQMPSWMALENGAKVIVKVDHRRSGKDLDTWNQVICRAVKNVGIHYYLFPTFAQGRKVIWEGMTNEGRPFMDYIPKSIRDGKPKEDDMQVRIKTRRDGKRAFSILQIAGTDKYNHLLGTNPITLVYSEYALQDPRARELFIPIVEANGATEMFTYTPRGSNHGKELFDDAVNEVLVHKNPEYYVQRLTIEDTFKGKDGSGNLIPIISKEQVEKRVGRGMHKEIARQEYYCSFEAGNVGAYYADILEVLKKEGRIREIPYDPTRKVDTYWDVAMTDDTCVWFSQLINSQRRWIDCYSVSGKGVAAVIADIQKKPYVYGVHTGPHDLKQSQFSSGESSWQVANRLGFRFEFANAMSIQDGINAARNLLTVSFFDEKKCVDGLKALRHYQRKWDDRERKFLSRPNHDWSSHFADAFRYAGTSIDSTPRLSSTRFRVDNNTSVFAN